MKALVIQGPNSFPSFIDCPDPQIDNGGIILELKAAALNRRDYYICKGLYPGINYPVILGSDGAGIYNGEEYIVLPGFGWNKNTLSQPEGYTILGMPRNGTFAQFVNIPAEQLYPKPKHLSWTEAAALGLGGQTAFRALFTKGNCRAGQNILITGIGGGVALTALQFALSAGARVFVTSGNDEKIESAMTIGAAGGVNYHTDNWHKALYKNAGPFDLIIDSAGGPGFTNLIELAGPGARIVIYGGTTGKIRDLSPQIIFWRQLSILGSTMSSAEEFVEMLEFVDKHRIVPIIDSVFGLDESDHAFNKLGAGSQFGKIVFQIGS